MCGRMLSTIGKLRDPLYKNCYKQIETDENVKNIMVNECADYIKFSTRFICLRGLSNGDCAKILNRAINDYKLMMKFDNNDIIFKKAKDSLFSVSGYWTRQKIEQANPRINMVITTINILSNLHDECVSQRKKQETEKKEQQAIEKQDMAKNQVDEVFNKVLKDMGFENMFN